jgi:cell division protein FtsQ
MFSRKKTSNKSNRRRNSTGRSPVYTVHARAADRRSETMHKTGAILLLVAAVVALAVGAVSGGRAVYRWLFAENPRFLVRQLDLTSTGRLTAAHIKEFGGLAEGQNLFALDIQEVRRKLEQGPLIKGADVQRQLPDTLVVRVQERQPLARIAQEAADFYFSVDLDGHVLGLAGRTQTVLPVVRGFSDRGVTPGSVIHDGGALDALQVIALCDGSPLGQVVDIDTIDVSQGELLDLTLRNGVRVWLPRNPSRAKLEDLVVFLRETGGRVRFIDLTMNRNIPAT